MTETRVYYPPPPGENRTSDMVEKRAPLDYRHVLYVVHPSTIDGDRHKVAKKAIQGNVNAATPDTRIILIAPPQESVYLEAGTQVSDIRSDVQYYRWVDEGDLDEDTKSVTLIGGNLELCLGAVYNEAHSRLVQRLKEAKKTEGKIDVVLPLDAIYTLNGTTAEANLQYLIRNGSPLEAVTALLSTNQPRNFNYGYEYGEYEVVSSYGKGVYDIELNGQLLGKLGEKPKEETPIPDGWISVLNWIPDPIITVGLKLFGDISGGATLSSDLARSFQAKLRHAREVVLPQFDLTR